MMVEASAADSDLKTLVLRMFLPWYVWQRPREIIRDYFSYVGAMMEVFSFAFLLKTLLSPWKAIQDSAPQKGFNLERWMESMALNMTTRMIGMIIRLLTILTGIVVQVALLIGFATYLAFWFAFPVLLVLVPVLFFR
jgi:hypothetical protein